MSNTTSSPTATPRQAEIIKMARAKRGVTRADIRNLMGKPDQNIPVQSILKNMAERFGFAFDSDGRKTNEAGREVAVYRFLTVDGSPRKVAVKERATAVVMAKPATKAAKAAKAAKTAAPARKSRAKKASKATRGGKAA